jgi:hypothetical protein
VSGPALVADVDHFRMRLLRDVMVEASVWYWLRRAEEFDSVGTPTAMETAKACRHRASLSSLDTWPELLDLYEEEAS